MSNSFPDMALVLALAEKRIDLYQFKIEAWGMRRFLFISWYTLAAKPKDGPTEREWRNSGESYTT
jgi:hypothetical protein